jgi:hypothetical protein
MPKMTKAQARRRLQEASQKLSAVQDAALTGKLGAVNMTDVKKLFPMMIELRKIADRMK